MSNAQNYNKALGLAAQAHTDKYNTANTRDTLKEFFDRLIEAKVF